MESWGEADFGSTIQAAGNASPGAFQVHINACVFYSGLQTGIAVHCFQMRYEVWGASLCKGL